MGNERKINTAHAQPYTDITCEQFSIPAGNQPWVIHKYLQLVMYQTSRFDCIFRTYSSSPMSIVLHGHEFKK